jgi:hypothetical protein
MPPVSENSVGWCKVSRDKEFISKTKRTISQKNFKIDASFGTA